MPNIAALWPLAVKYSIFLAIVAPLSSLFDMGTELLAFLFAPVGIPALVLLAIYYRLVGPCPKEEITCPKDRMSTAMLTYMWPYTIVTEILPFTRWKGWKQPF